MKQFIFTINTNSLDRELIINAKGMTDAVEQVKQILKMDQSNISTQAKSIEFKGVKYLN
ncbi:MAG: hypothetical protein ACQEWV_30680 [Bacillota bacterium]